MMTTFGAVIVLTVNALVAMRPALSVTFSVKVKVPAVLNVPLSTPALLSVNPDGSVEPAFTLQV